MARSTTDESDDDSTGTRESQDPNSPAQDVYKVYRKRWLVLLAIFTINLVNGLQKSILPIVDIFNEHMDMTVDNYNVMCQISLFLSLAAVLPLARALEHYGLRKMAYINCLAIIIAHSLKAICFFDEKHVGEYYPTIPVKRRYYFLLVAEVFIGLATSVSNCFAAKVAYDWFPIGESTRAFVLASVGYNVGAGASNYIVPILIIESSDMYKMGYMFLISAATMTSIVLLFIRRSRPKVPPSSNAVLSAQTDVSLSEGLKIMLTNPSYVLLLITISLNTSTIGDLQITLDDILRSHGYSDTFCGLLISHAFIFGIAFSLIGAAWVDNSSNYITVSRMASILYAITYVAFSFSLDFPDIKSVILVTNIFTSFGNSLVIPSLIQVSLRSAASILPEATVAALNLFINQTFAAILLNLEPLMRQVSPRDDEYKTLLISFAILVLLVNLLYSATFKMPKRKNLQEKLDRKHIPLSCSPEILNNEPTSSKCGTHLRHLEYA